MEWEEARQAVEENRAILLDIRSLPEHREQRIPGSRHLNYYEFTPQNARRVLGIPGSALVLVYCRSGAHSGAAASKLWQYGYRAVNMGNIHDWPWELEGSFY